MTTKPKTSRVSEMLRGSQELALSGDNGRALAIAAEAWFAATAECQRELIGFVSMRLEKDSETARDMLGCRNLADVTTIQARWIDETLRDYNAEMAKLTTICMKSLNGGGRAGG